MADDLLLLTPDTFRRVRDAVRDNERGGNGRGHRASTPFTTPLTGHARLLQAGSGSNFLPGKIVATRNNIDYEDFGDCWITDLNDAFLTVRRYPVRFIGIHTDEKPIVSVDYCCGGDISEPIPPGPPCGTVMCVGPLCVGFTIRDYAGAEVTVYAFRTTPSGDNTTIGFCDYETTWATANDVGRVYFRYFTPTGPIGPITGGDDLTTFGCGGIQLVVNGLLGGEQRQATGNYSWDGNGDAPLPPLFASGGTQIPTVVRVSPADYSQCTAGGGGAGGGTGDTGGGTGGGGTTYNNCYVSCYHACVAAYGYPEAFCINNCAVGCFSGGLGTGFGGSFDSGPRSASCSGGDCGCGGSCGGSVTPTSVYTDLRFWRTVDYVNTIATSTLKPLDESVTDVGNVGAGEDDLHTFTVPANTLLNNGDSITYTVTFVIAAGATATPRVRFNNVVVYAPTSAVVAASTTARVVTVTITRKTSTTARASAGTTGSEEAYYTDDATLTGLNFGAAITLKSTGQATNNNDIKAVHTLTAKVPTSDTLTLAGVQTMPTVLSYGTASQCSIAQDAAGYTGASATLLHTGSASGAQDVDVYIVPSVSVGAGQIVRVFKEIGGTKVAVFQKAIAPRTALATDPTWQAAEYICTVRVNGTSEKVYISKEVNEAMLARGEPRNYFAA